jgi:hypothetical protein
MRPRPHTVARRVIGRLCEAAVMRRSICIAATVLVTTLGRKRRRRFGLRGPHRYCVDGKGAGPHAHPGQAAAGDRGLDLLVAVTVGPRRLAPQGHGRRSGLGSQAATPDDRDARDGTACLEAGRTLKRPAASSFYSALNVGIADHCRATARSAQPAAGFSLSLRVDGRRRHHIPPVDRPTSSRTAGFSLATRRHCSGFGRGQIPATLRSKRRVHQRNPAMVHLDAGARRQRYQRLGGTTHTIYARSDLPPQLKRRRHPLCRPPAALVCTDQTAIPTVSLRTQAFQQPTPIHHRRLPRFRHHRRGRHTDHRRPRRSDFRGPLVVNDHGLAASGRIPVSLGSSVLSHRCLEHFPLAAAGRPILTTNHRGRRDHHCARTQLAHRCLGGLYDPIGNVEHTLRRAHDMLDSIIDTVFDDGGGMRLKARHEVLLRAYETAIRATL